MSFKPDLKFFKKVFAAAPCKCFVGYIVMYNVQFFLRCYAIKKRIKTLKQKTHICSCLRLTENPKPYFTGRAWWLRSRWTWWGGKRTERFTGKRRRWTRRRWRSSRADSPSTTVPPSRIEKSMPTSLDLTVACCLAGLLSSSTWGGSTFTFTFQSVCRTRVIAP